MRIPVDSIVTLMHDQDLFATTCYDELDLVQTSRHSLRDLPVHHHGDHGSNGHQGRAGPWPSKPLESDTPPVLLAQLVKLSHGVWVRDVLTLHRVHVVKFWSSEQIDQIEADQRELLKRYHDAPVLRTAIDSHDENTSLDVAWVACPSK